VSFVNVWAQGVLLPASMAGGLSFRFLLGEEPGNNQRQSLELPYARSLSHEHVPSQVLLRISKRQAERGLGLAFRFKMCGCSGKARREEGGGRRTPAGARKKELLPAPGEALVLSGSGDLEAATSLD
jgi:hypothetical protein